MASMKINGPNIYRYISDCALFHCDMATASSVKDESLHHQSDGYSCRTQPNQPECPSRTSGNLLSFASRI